MARKNFDWAAGVRLPEHSRRKHKIIEEYFEEYLHVRCQLPNRTKFKLVVVDGFAGGGRYVGGEPGSPLIFIETLEHFVIQKNVERAANGLPAIEISCVVLLNDFSSVAIDILSAEIAPLEYRIQNSCPQLHLQIHFSKKPFEVFYKDIVPILEELGTHNVIFNLDQGGFKHVLRSTISDIMHRFRKAEIIYTVLISSMIAFLQRNEPDQVREQLSAFDFPEFRIDLLDDWSSKDRWLGLAERLVFNALKNCAPFVSPFSIQNPEGWRYWLVHFANEPRARQVYNDVLHSNSGAQGHFGRAGLQMLSFDPSIDSAALYLFDLQGRIKALDQLYYDIPKIISGSGDAVEVSEFYRLIYNETPAHSDDIHKAIIESPDLEVRTASGGTRREGRRISRTDQILLKRQASFFPIFRNN